MPVLKLTPAQSDAVEVIGAAFVLWVKDGARVKRLIEKYGADLPDDAAHPLRALAELLDHPAIGFCRCDDCADQGAVALAVFTHPDSQRSYCLTHAASRLARCPACGDVVPSEDLVNRPVPGVGDLRLCVHCASQHQDGASYQPGGDL